MIARWTVLVCCALLAVAPGEAAETIEPASSPAASELPNELVVPPRAWVELTPPGPRLTLEAALDGGLLTPVDGGLEAPAEGDHWLTVASRDAAGERSALRWLRLRVDAEAPEIELAIEPAPVDPQGAAGAPWIGPGAAARATALDPLAGLEILELAAGGDTVRGPSGKLRLPLPPSGEVTVSARAKDNVGNHASAQPLTLRIDSTAPTGEIELVGPHTRRNGRLFAAPDVRAEVRSEDRDSGIAMHRPRVNGEVVEDGRFDGPWSPGLTTLDAELEDRVGNRGATPALEVEIDAEGPAVEYRVQGSGERPEGVPSGDDQTTRAYRPPVTVTVGAEDAAGVTALAWSADGESWTALPEAGGELTTSAPSAELRAEDGVGNQRTLTARWLVDSEPPLLFLEGPNGEVKAGELVELVQGETIRLRAEDRGSSLELQQATLVSRLRWRDLPLEWSFPTRGRYRLVARTRDALGHESQVSWRIFVGRKEVQR